MTHLPDEAMARRIREGGPQALDPFFVRFAGPLLGFLLRMVGDRDVAEDLLQETMLRVFRGIERYRERGSFRAWVYRIAANLAVSHLRRARWITVESPAILERTPDERAPNAQARLERAEAERELRAGLAALSVEHRTVLLLRVGEGMSLSEVAEVLCVAEGTVKSRLHYAVARMRAHAARVRSAAAEGRRA